MRLTWKTYPTLRLPGGEGRGGRHRFAPPLLASSSRCHPSVDREHGQDAPEPRQMRGRRALIQRLRVLQGDPVSPTVATFPCP